MAKKFSELDDAINLDPSNLLAATQDVSSVLESRKISLAVFKAWLDLQPPIVEAGTTLAVTLSHLGRIVQLTSAADQTITLPEDTTENLPAGFQTVFLITGDGIPTFQIEGADTLISVDDLVQAHGKGAWITIYKPSSGVWVLGGNLA